MAKKHMLQHKGASKKSQGQSAGDSHKADTNEKKSQQIENRGPGSSYANSFLRNEAVRVKALKKIPGNFGYKTPVDMSKWTHQSASDRKKRLK